MKPFIPHELPLKDLDWSGLISQIGQANRELARYDGFLQFLPNAQLLLSPLITQEAVLSSRIEGTQATLEDVLKYEAQPRDETQRLSDIREIINYRTALRYAVDELVRRPISLNLLKETHHILLSNARGKDRMLGRFRTVQNWIGAPASNIENATYVPPSPDRLNKALDNFEKYIHFEEKDQLVQIAIVHAQFEIIHPFLDGNGRIGRILIPLFLYEKKILHSPMFYISAYFETHRQEYYSRLNAITTANDWEGWIIYFLKAIETQASKNNIKARQVLELYNKMKQQVVETTRSQFAIQVIDCLFDFPIFQSQQFQEKTGIPKASANRILGQLRDAGILTVLEEAKGSRSAVYLFKKLIDIVEQ